MPDESTSRNVESGPLVLGALGLLLFLLGATRFFLRHHFGLTDALYCAIVIVPAGILLLVFDYVLHHAKLVSVIPICFAGLLLFTFPVFDVALGLTLMAAVARPALSSWKDERRQSAD